MRKYMAVFLILLLLAGCKSPAEESPDPTESPVLTESPASQEAVAPLTLSQFLSELGPEDVNALEWGRSGFRVEAETLLRALQAALDHPAERGEKTENSWQLRLPLTSGGTFSESGGTVFLWAGLEEDLVAVEGGVGLPWGALWVEDETLYRLVRGGRDISPDIDRTAYEKYRGTVEEYFDRELRVWNRERERDHPGQTAAGWELQELRLAGENRDLGIQVYKISSLLYTDPERKVFDLAGGSRWVDGGLRLHREEWEEGYAYLGVADGQAVGVFVLGEELDMGQFRSREDLVRRARALDWGDLTEEEIGRVNRAFSVYENGGEETVALAANGFFTSYYADVRELDLEEFLRYFPSDGTLEGEDREEFAALARLPGFPWEEDFFAESGLTPDRLPVPTHRHLRSSVDDALRKYAGITAKDLTDPSGPLYLPAYDAWYNFTSDFGPGSFTCVGGRVEGDTAVLWSGELYGEGIREELTLKREGERWYIRSFLRAPLCQGASLGAQLLGLQGEEIKEVTDGWGFGRLPQGETVAELVRKAAQNPAGSWEYEDQNGVERTVWDMELTLAGGKQLYFEAGLREGVVRVVDNAEPEKAAYFRAPELYWTLRREYDSGEGRGTIDREALERYREAVEGYLAAQAWAPEVRVELTGLTLVQEDPALNAQVWDLSVDLTTDPPELAPGMVGNGYVDSKLRMYPITSDGPESLLVTANGEALGLQSRTWLEEGGLDRYATAEELREDMR